MTTGTEPDHPHPLLRVKFTALTLAAMFALASLTTTFGSKLGRGVLREWGWGPVDVTAGEVYRLISSALLTSGGAVFWMAVGMVVIMVGAAEWRFGSLRSGAVFWLGHVATLASLAVITRLARVVSGSESAAWIAGRDVGPSAGAFACLGLVVRSLRSRHQWLMGGAVVGALLVDALFLSGPGSSERSADVAHLIAFPLGYLMGSGVTDS